jgi:hypothetical protein
LDIQQEKFGNGTNGDRVEEAKRVSEEGSEVLDR